MGDIVTEQGIVTYISFYTSGPYPFNSAVVTFTDTLSNPGQTWNINPLLPDAVNSRLGVSAMTAIQLFSNGVLVAQYTLQPGGSGWQSACLESPTGSPISNEIIVYDPACKVLTIMDQNVGTGSKHGGGHHHKQ